jgi:hypothetical protein
MAMGISRCVFIKSSTVPAITYVLLSNRLVYVQYILLNECNLLLVLQKDQTMFITCPYETQNGSVSSAQVSFLNYTCHKKDFKWNLYIKTMAQDLILESYYTNQMEKKIIVK